MAKTIIKNYVFRPGIGYLDNKFPNAWNLFNQNKDFILSEIIYYLNQEITDVPKCIRDLGYMLEGVAFDLGLDTNYYARFIGYTEVNSLDLSPTVKRHILRLQTAILDLPDVGNSSTSINRINAYFTELLNIIDNGRNAASTLSLNDPLAAPPNQVAAKNQILNNINFITAEVNAWVEAYYPDADHDVDKCTRDVKYALEAMAYDILYGGNSATYDQSKFFFYNYATNEPGIDETHLDQTVAGYTRLKDIIGDIVLGIAITPTGNNTEIQDISGNAATSTEVSLLTVLADIVISVVGSATFVEAQTYLDGINRNVPVVSLWADAEIQAAHASILANGFSGLEILGDITWDQEYTYNEEKCTRDAGFVLDAYLYDLRYGGNEQTVGVVQYYWDEDVAQVDGNRLPEIDTHAFIGELINDYIFANIEYNKKGSVDQTLDLALTAESGAYVKITELVNTTVAVITDGLSAMPTTAYNEVGTVKFTGMYNLEDILLITNVQSNEIIYNFGTSIAGGKIKKSKKYDADFPAYNQTTDFIITLTLNYNTENANSDDELQIFVEQSENGKSILTTRPYNFGTDAIERNRVANPLSMLDADFEYGLQPTKWAAIGTLRGYPSIYEIPGTDTPIQSITTDASAGSNDIGQSLITVTTVGPHGLEPGDPITVKALEDSISGAARAEGSFVITTTPSNNRLTYYAKAKVGTVDGEVIATSYSQLRKAGFYSGADIGTPTFTVLSQGADSLITTELTILTGASLIPFDGIAPGLGSPITDDVGFPVGTQVTSVFSQSEGGGTYISKDILGDWPAGNLYFDCVDATGVIDDLAIDRGDGTAVFVESVSNNRVFLTDPLLTSLTGNTATYQNITPQNDITSGSDATFDISATGATYNVVVNNPGQDYETGNRIIITGNVLGGINGQHDLIITIDAVDINGSIASISHTGSAFDGTATIANLTGTVSGNIGQDAIFDIEFTDNLYTISVSSPDTSSGYAVDDKILIPGTSIPNGDETNDIILTVTVIGTNGALVNVTSSGTAPDALVTYSNPGWTTSGTGDITNFDVTRTGTTYSVNFYASFNFVPADTITITGIELGGQSPANDLQITVNTVGTNGDILTFSILGTAVNSDYTYDVAGQNLQGQNGEFTINLVAGSYSNPIITNSGLGFAVDQKITILGTALLGTSPTNDLILQVTAVDNNYMLTGVTVFSGLANSTIDPVTDLIGSNDNPSGNGAQITVTRTLNIYTISVTNGGQGYKNGDRLLIPGNYLGGQTPAHDLAIILLETNNGQIIDDSSGRYTLEYSATATPTIVNFICTIQVTEATEADIPQGTEIDFTALASLQVEFDQAHGLVPGDSFIVAINSDDTFNDHNLGSGSFFVTDIPAINKLTYQARTTGFINTDVQLVDTPNEQYTPTVNEWFEYSGVIDDTPTDFIRIYWNSEIILQINNLENPIEFNNIRNENPDTYIVSNTLRYARGVVEVNTPPTAVRYRVSEIVTTSEEQDPLNGKVYPRPDSFFIHRPYDGGVQLGTGGPQHGAQAIRQSKKYIRYQSGKGIMYTTGALFAPSYDLRSVTSDGVEVGSIITIVTDDNDHGVQEGGVIRLLGIETPGYSSGPETRTPPEFDYTVVSVVNERTFTVRSLRRLGSTTAVLGFGAQMSVVSWHGATVRSGIFDDQNGIFWEYDGTNVNVVQRTGTKQISGTIAINQNENVVTGTNTKFRDQLIAGDRIIIKGMTHVVSHVSTDTSMTVTPDWRGVSSIAGAKAALINEKRVKQADFNLDTLDGNGPSGYNIDIAKMQMIGIQYSWYGAGFIDFMLRGTDGNFTFCHRMRNSNVNTEAFMRSGNLPVRYEVTNEGPSGKLLSNIDNSQQNIPLYDSSFFPQSGTIYIDNEIISFDNNDIATNTLTNCTRGAAYSNFQAGANRTYTAGAPATHLAKTGVILISQTITPLISHWGSAFLTDGGFDEDRGYIFSYTVSSLPITTAVSTAFLIRLAPSVSNALVGDLGERELLNRAQLLLQGIEITSDSGAAGGIVIDGILNPQNYPSNPSAVNWSGLSNQAQGGQPSFAQVANGGAIDWGAATTTTATATVQADIDTGYVFSGLGRDRYSPLPLSLTQYQQTPILPGSIIYSNSPDAFTDATETYYVTGIIEFPSFNEIDLYYNSSLGRTQSQGNTNTGTNFKFIYETYTGKTSQLMFTKASWEASGATIGTSVSTADTNWPAGTAVVAVDFKQHGLVEFYEVSFNNSSVNAINAGNTVTFEFGTAAYAQPGETVFSFIANPGERSVLDLTQLKELTNTPLGGRGIYPNGPDILAINVYKVSGASVNSNITLRWGEAQA